MTRPGTAPSPLPGDERPSPREPTSRDVLVRIALLALGIRAALELIGAVSVAVHGHPVLPNALTMWDRWDAPHYLRLAEVGYRPVGAPGDDPLFIVFFPFFPLAVRIVATVVRNLVLGGLVVSYAASVGGAYFLYRLRRLDAGHDDAWRCVLLLFAFPTAYFLSAPYTEALFLFAVVASVYAARTSRWTRAGLAGALATGTRVAGVALLPALLAEVFTTPGSRDQRAKRAAAVALAGGGLLVYLAINQVVHGDPFWFLEVQGSHWYQQAVPPWQPIFDAVGALVRGAPPAHTFILRARLAGFAFALPLLLLAPGRLRRADTVYGWAGFVLILSTSWLISLPRYLLGLYPLVFVGATLTRSRRVLWAVLIVSICAQAWFFSRYAVGTWTF